ncbi:MAG: response regulator [Anaerolineae bacterium]|jgi:signal transduction histidine kinase|nr:response regulator [Anaerolineae bacterium]
MSLILVIEDEEQIRNNIAEILTYEGYRVAQAPNGMRGVQMAQEHQPDLVLCDVLMPGLNGWDVLLELRSNAATANVQFVFLTALADRANARKGMSHGADDYLPKPFSHKELLETVAMRLRRAEELRVRHAKQIDQIRHNIIYALPHELRSPLTGILSCAEFLLMDHPTGLEQNRVQNVARIIERSGRRLQRLIENYLYYTQLEIAGNDVAQRADFQQHTLTNPGAVIFEAAKERANAHSRANDLVLDLENAPVQANEENLQRLISELVDNACKFSEPSTAIRVETRLEGAVMALRISDHGRGMHPEEIMSIAPFAQFQRSLFEQQGVGLGLAIVRRLTALYDGHFAIHSAPQAGTTVSVTLPMR